MRGTILRTGFCWMFVALLSACHAQKNLKQTFVLEADSSQSLTLMSQVGMVRPAAEFPHNLLFKLFGSEELSGTYEMKTATGTITGKFTAGREGDQQWIKFAPGDAKEWTAKLKPGGQLVGEDDEIWELKTITADAKVEQRLKIGG